MHSVVLIAALWVVVGIPAFVRFLQERREVPMTDFQRAMGALRGSGTDSGSPGAIALGSRRRLVSTLTYVPGVVLVVVGALRDDTGMLATSVGLFNLGTLHRLLAVRIDRSSRRSAPRKTAPLLDFGPARLEPPFEPGVDQGPGDAQSWGDGWQIIGPEPRRVDDLVLVDANVS